MQKTKTPHILVVDDDPVTLMVITKYLKEESFEFTTTESGEEALNLLQKNPRIYSAIILDRMMPKVSGIDVLHKLYINPTLNKIPIIMLTSHAEREDVGAAIIAGVFDFLFKPVDKDLLILVLRRALKKAASCVSS